MLVTRAMLPTMECAAEQQFLKRMAEEKLEIELVEDKQTSIHDASDTLIVDGRWASFTIMSEAFRFSIPACHDRLLFKIFHAVDDLIIMYKKQLVRWGEVGLEQRVRIYEGRANAQCVQKFTTVDMAIWVVAFAPLDRDVNTPSLEKAA